MRTLTIGVQGADVRAWQEFLAKQGFSTGAPDGAFSAQTASATKEFQLKNGLAADGIPGPITFSKAIQLGFSESNGNRATATERQMLAPAIPADALALPLIAVSLGSPRSTPDWPAPPPFAPIASLEAVEQAFGRFDYVDAGGDDIKIVGSWEQENIVKVHIPQLEGERFVPGGWVRFHRRGADQLKALWAAWDAAGLLRLKLSFDGAYYPRYKRKIQPHIRKNLSNHSFGTAFDINAAQNPLGGPLPLVGQRGSVREMVELAYRHGFYWGGHFGNGRADGMHFEIAAPFK
jgi:peptidoglycan hydrolase-like protein with peptidoglycan-binding domain